MLGTRLDVGEELLDVDADDPDAPAYAVYEYLAFLLSEVVDALERRPARSGPADGLSRGLRGTAALLVSRPYPQRGASPGCRQVSQAPIV